MSESMSVDEKRGEAERVDRSSEDRVSGEDSESREESSAARSARLADRVELSPPVLAFLAPDPCPS